jgi:hypothetical protein
MAVPFWGTERHQTRAESEAVRVFFQNQSQPVVFDQVGLSYAPPERVVWFLLKLTLKSATNNSQNHLTD